MSSQFQLPKEPIDFRALPKEAYSNATDSDNCYLVGIKGDQLSPELPDSALAIIDGGRKPRKDEYVCLMLKGRGQPMICKLLLAPPPDDFNSDELKGVYFCGLADPKTRRMIDIDDVKNIHPVIGYMLDDKHHDLSLAFKILERDFEDWWVSTSFNDLPLSPIYDNPEDVKAAYLELKKENPSVHIYGGGGAP
jgi:hypothetical protein